jgi:hypothetical protein
VNAYCTIAQLAEGLRITVTPANTDMLTRCAEAAAVEIDASLDLVDAPDYTEPWNPLWQSVNVLRGVEWFKANDAAFGILGIHESAGAIRTPRNPFIRHALTLLPSKEQFGLA